MNAFLRFSGVSDLMVSLMILEVSRVVKRFGQYGWFFSDDKPCPFGNPAPFPTAYIQEHTAVAEDKLKQVLN